MACVTGSYYLWARPAGLGPSGSQGPAGPTGPTGATGPQGPSGSTGPAGPSVLTWIDGSTRLKTTASVSIDSTNRYADALGSDVFFFASGTVNRSPGTAGRKVGLFGGDLNVSGSATFPGGLSGSLQRLPDGLTNYMVGAVPMNVATGSSGQIVLTYSSPSTQGLRLTLRTGEPIPSVDTTSGSILYFTPHRHGSVSIFDGTNWIERVTNEVNLTLSSLTINKNYDVFATWTGSAVAIELGPAWTSDTARSTAVVRSSGVLVKSGDATRRYVGSIRTNSTTTTQDTLKQRYVYNEDNQVERYMFASDATTTWTYNSLTRRQANANVANKVEVLVGGIVSRPYRVRCESAALSSSGVTLIVGIGHDSITTAATGQRSMYGERVDATANDLIPAYAQLEGVETIGYHFYAWLESVNAGGTITITGTNVSITSGIAAFLDM